AIPWRRAATRRLSAEQSLKVSAEDGTRLLPVELSLLEHPEMRVEHLAPPAPREPARIGPEQQSLGAEHVHRVAEHLRLGRVALQVLAPRADARRVGEDIWRRVGEHQPLAEHPRTQV